MGERDDFRTLMIAMLALCGVFLAATLVAFLASGCAAHGVRPLQSQREMNDRWDPDEVSTCSAKLSDRCSCDREIRVEPTNGGEK